MGWLVPRWENREALKEKITRTAAVGRKKNKTKIDYSHVGSSWVTIWQITSPLCPRNRGREKLCPRNRGREKLRNRSEVNWRHDGLKCNVRLERVSFSCKFKKRLTKIWSWISQEIKKKKDTGIYKMYYSLTN